MVGGGSGGGGSCHLSKRDEKRNPDVDPRLRVMEMFRYFFVPANIDGHTLPKRA